MKKKKSFKLGKRKLLIAITILSILAISLGIFFSLPFIKGATIEPPKPTPTPNWGSTTIEVAGHNFSIKDSVLTDIVKTGTSQPNIIVEYKNKQPISWWKFFDGESHRPHGNIPKDLDEVVQLSKHKYYIYPLPGVSTFFLIIDESTNTTVGIFEKITINKCHTGATQTTPDKIVPCPWEYYKAYTSYGGATDKFVFINEKGDQLKPEYELPINKPNTLLTKYIQSINADKYAIYGAGGQMLTCAKPGSELSGDDYAKCFFPEGGRFPVSIKDNGDKPPTITVSGSTFDQKKHPGAQRPTITYTLSYVLVSGNVISSGIGGGLSGANYFYFVATNPSYPNLAIRLLNCEEKNYFVTTGDKEKLNDDEKIGTEPIVQIDQKSLTSFVNKVYSGGPYKDGECPVKQLNVDDEGQLAKWGVERVNSEEAGGGGESECVNQACNVDGVCGSTGIGAYNPFNFKCIFCRIGCFIYDAVGSFVEWTIKVLNKAAGISQNFFVEKAWAAEANTLSNQLKSDQIKTGWKFSLAAVDIIVIFALLIIAFANILKLNIDIYAVKKALPGLLIGVILANFSLLICRVIVDFASLFSNHFLDMAVNFIREGQKTGIIKITEPASRDLIGSALVSLMGISPQGTGAIGIITLLTIIGIGVSLPGVGCIIALAALLFLAFPGLLILALAFLLYVRLYVVWILTILAPLAFVILGFPPAQQYFKQWWSWFLKWVFLGPIAYFLIGLAAVLGSIQWWTTADTSLSFLGRWLLGMIVLVMAIYVPFKLGGAIMNLWATRVGKPLAMGLDAIIGRVTGGWSPYGLYKGAKEAFGASWRRHEATATGHGRVVGETLTATPRALWAMIRQPGGIRARFGAGRELLRQKQEETARRNAAAEIQNIRQEYEQALASLNDQDLENTVKNAIQNRDFQTATAGLIQAGERGLENFQDLADNYLRNFPNVRADVAKDIAEAASINSPNGPVLASVRIVNNRVETRNEDELLRRMQQLLNRSFHNLKPYQREERIQEMVRRLGTRFTQQGGQLNPHDFASLAHLARTTASPSISDAFRQQIIDRVRNINLNLGNSFNQTINNFRTNPQFGAQQAYRDLESSI